mmetsp:Transcript_10393/g.15878  ORF Transcript_10393/g.15878 Transcript_10393/m.15878 type:complete len:343 (-) Transcript_10393:44-1072(-)
MLKLIVAGILCIPCLLFAIAVTPIIGFLALPSLILLLFRKGNDAPQVEPDRIVIVGGSSGIGLSIAKECVKKNFPRVILLARNKEKLQKAKECLESESHSTKVEIVSVSVSDYAALQKVVEDLNIKDDERTILFNCAGIPFTTEFEKVPIEQYQKLVDTNQLGSMYLARAFLPVMKQGTIVLTSSAAAQAGVYGYSIYSPTKYALRGFAETMHAELLYSHPNVHIQIAFPADTNTPGYEEESKMMPEITKKLNESAGLANPDDSARKMLKCALAKNPKFAVYFNLEGWMLANLTAGMSPVSSLGDAMTQVAFSGVFRIISLFVLNDWWRIIRAFRSESKKVD